MPTYKAFLPGLVVIYVKYILQISNSQLAFASNKIRNFNDGRIFHQLKKCSEKEHFFN